MHPNRKFKQYKWEETWITDETKEKKWGIGNNTAEVLNNTRNNKEQIWIADET